MHLAFPSDAGLSLLRQDALAERAFAEQPSRQCIGLSEAVARGQASLCLGLRSRSRIADGNMMCPEYLLVTRASRYVMW